MKILLYNSKKLILLMLMMQTLVFAATNTYTGANGDWNTATNWSLQIVPTAADDVVIPTGKSVNISADSFAKSINLSGALTINDGIRLTVYNDFTVNFGGSFIMPGGSALSTLVVYGNYVNYGSTDFWKSTVVIAGDLLSSATSDLQKQGNVVVGGNIIGDFDLTGGTGTAQIYAVNPNATVVITPTSIDNNVAPGTEVKIPTESQALVDLVNEVIYGGSICTFNSSVPNMSACAGNTKTITVATNSSSPTYAWQVNSGSGWGNVPNAAPYSGITSASLTITGITAGLDKSKYRAIVTSGGCSKNSNYGVLSVSSAPPEVPGSISGLATQCQNNAGQVYSVPLSSIAVTYTWTLPAGWKITNPVTTPVNSNTLITTSNAITVTSGTSGGTISVTATNGCSASAVQTLAVTTTTTATTPTAPTIGAPSGITCAQFTANWGASANTTSYVLEVSTKNGTGANSFNNNRILNLDIGNVTSYPVTLLTASTQYFYRITAVNICQKASSTILNVTTSLSTLTAPATIKGSITVCASSIQTYSILAIDNATNYFWSFPLGWTVTGGQGTTSVNVTPATNSGNVTIEAGNDCATSVTKTLTVTVNSTPTSPVASLIQPTCTLATGTITITSPPTGAGITYSINGSTYTNTTGIFTLIASGTYNVTAKNASGCISSVTSITIKSATNTWDGSAWSNVTEPLITENIEFAGDYNSFINLVGTNLSACSCKVNADVYVDVNSGHTLTLTNELKVFGNILFKDKSSLVQINNVTNIGKIEYERKISSSIRPTDYIYWSSPVAGFTLGGVYPNNTAGLFYSYGVISGVEDWQPESATTVMDAGIGYIINGAQPTSGPSPPPSTNPFFGVPNNGDVTVPVPYNNKFGLATTNPDFGVSYLLGNPYPSAIDANKFLNDNAAVLEGTLYFWTHNTQIGIGVSAPGTGVYAYSGNDYAAYNITGGVGAFPPDIDPITGQQIITSPATNSGDNNSTPNGKIASGQGFFATAKAQGTVTFTNAMRLAGTTETDGSGVNQQFFKTKNPGKSSKPIEKNRLWLNLTNTQGAFKQTLVGYITDATNDYDDRFDGESFDGNEFVDFYSVNQDKNLVIQGRALPFDENDEVPLGFRTTINGAFTINIDQVDGFLTNQAVFIEDKLTNTVFDLKSGNYTFNTVEGTFDDRFVLRFKDNSTARTLAVANFDLLEKTVLVSNKNKQIKVDSAVERIDKVTVFDLLGRQIYQKANVNSNELSIATLVSNRQMLMVKTTLQNGKTVTKKIIY
jgi:hypothetical protein